MKSGMAKSLVIEGLHSPVPLHKALCLEVRGPSEGRPPPAQMLRAGPWVCPDEAGEVLCQVQEWGLGAQGTLALPPDTPPPDA